MKYTKAKDLQIGDIIFEDEMADFIAPSYFMMMVIDKTEKNLIVKDYSQQGKICEYSLNGSWETEYSLPDIKIGEKVRQDQLKYKRDKKINDIGI